ncbi:MAG TPA: glutathione S-transferase family protein [Caulobacteraceae bacterium]|nr:glutathione S-transferase family protein [Caulobacteraceae bacterium]
MKLYCDPISTTSRPVLLFLADHDLAVEVQHVCLLTGEHFGEAYSAINPNRQVPCLVDGDLVLPESSAILKHLADAAGSPAYPTERKARSRVNAAMDWFNTGYSFSMNYQHVYPQFLPNHAWEDPQVQAAVTARGLAIGREKLDVLDRHMLADRFVCGPDVTLADYLGGAYVGLSEAIGFDLSPWPKVAAWMDRLRARPGWDEVHAAFYGFLAKLAQARAAA